MARRNPQRRHADRELLLFYDAEDDWQDALTLLRARYPDLFPLPEPQRETLNVHPDPRYL